MTGQRGLANRDRSADGQRNESNDLRHRWVSAVESTAYFKQRVLFSFGDLDVTRPSCYLLSVTPCYSLVSKVGWFTST